MGKSKYHVTPSVDEQSVDHVKRFRGRALGENRENEPPLRQSTWFRGGCQLNLVETLPWSHCAHNGLRVFLRKPGQRRPARGVIRNYVLAQRLRRRIAGRTQLPRWPHRWGLGGA